MSYLEKFFFSLFFWCNLNHIAADLQLSRFDVMGWRKNSSQSKNYKGLFLLTCNVHAPLLLLFMSKFWQSGYPVQVQSAWVVKVQNWLRQISNLTTDLSKCDNKEHP